MRHSADTGTGRASFSTTPQKRFPLKRLDIIKSSGHLKIIQTSSQLQSHRSQKQEMGQRGVELDATAAGAAVDACEAMMVCEQVSCPVICSFQPGLDSSYYKHIGVLPSFQTKADQTKGQLIRVSRRTACTLRLKASEQSSAIEVFLVFQVHLHCFRGSQMVSGCRRRC